MHEGQRKTLRAALSPASSFAQMGDAVRLLAGMVLRGQIEARCGVPRASIDLALADVMQRVRHFVSPPRYFWLGADADSIKYQDSK